MRKQVWLMIALVVSLSFMLFTASCTKNVVQTQPEATAAPEVQKEPERPAEEEEQAVQPVEQNEAEDVSREVAETVFVNENVHFALDSYALTDHAQEVLNSMADYMRTNPDVSIVIEGHCDDRGTDVYNLALGERRANSVKSFLADLGIGINRMNTVSYGEERPLVMGQDEASWAQNRRAQFVIN